MITSFDPWLRALRNRRIPEGAITIDRGLPFALAFSVNGDWSDATLAASLALAPDSGATLVDLSVSAGDYDAGSDVTGFLLSLTEAQTSVLPDDDDGDALVSLALDILMTPAGGDPIRVGGGVATVAGNLTNV